MTAIDITPGERQTGQIDPVHLAEATRSLKEDGYVILNDAVEREHAEHLCDKMLADVQTILSRDDVPFNFNTGNVQQDPPPFPPYLYKDVLLNNLVIDITRSILGSGMKNTFYSGNTVLPKQGGRQPVHVDVGQLWPDLEVATPPYALVVNLLPMDVSPHNGSTEIWPGTHTDTTVSWQMGDLKIPAEKVEARRAVSPPFQATARAGTVVIRDIRLWHAGMPNFSDTPRPMIAMIHFVGWWNEPASLEFPVGTEEFFQHPHLTTHAKFVDGPINYLNRHQAFDFQK